MTQVEAHLVEPRCTEPFRAKCELAVELFREQVRIAKGRHLAVFDGGYALGSVVRPLISPVCGDQRPWRQLFGARALEAMRSVAKIV
jgi:hypothetical protein